MARGKWIDKKSATTFTLVHRPQNDPRIHDESAPQMVLNPTNEPPKPKRLDDLASEFGSDSGSIRDNEGEAANYGIYYDDSKYDYMQHLRDPNTSNTSGGDVVFVPATVPTNDKGEKKQEPLEEALKRMDLEKGPEALVMDEDMLPTKNLQKLSYQRQQDVPDYIAGFQPDMDPRLREVLEALENDAYIDDEDDTFRELAEDPKEISAFEFEDQYFDDQSDDGWESDRTAKPDDQNLRQDEPSDGPDGGDASDPDRKQSTDKGEHTESGDWMEHYTQFQKDRQSGRKPIARTRSELQPSIISTSTAGGRRKKRKGALTSASTYSMTSSSIARTEHMTILDARFEKVDEEYQRDDDGDDGDDMKSISAVSNVSGLSAFSTSSSVQGPVRGDFDGILDDFLSTNQPKLARGKKQGRVQSQSGLLELDEVRRQLGPARVTSRG